MALFLKRLLLTLLLAFPVFLLVSAVSWAAGYFIRFTRVGPEPQVSLRAEPLGLIFFLILVFAAWLSVKILPRRSPSREPGRRRAA